MKDILQASAAGTEILRTLRMPSARNAYVLFPFAREAFINGGYTLVLASGEKPVSPGSGQVVAVRQAFASWSHSPGDLDSFSPYEVLIDHGEGIVSVVSGFSSVSVSGGQTLERGAPLGVLATSECFFGVSINGKFVNPQQINATFKPLDGNWVTGQGHRLRFAPDRLVRNLSGGIVSVLNAGLRWFTGNSLLVNVDFNGNGTKTGAAAVGSPGDFWNVYTPVEFDAVTAPGCYLDSYLGGYYGSVFSSDPMVALKSSSGKRSPVLLEKVSPLVPSGGSVTVFDPMLGTFAGGFDMFAVPVVNEFRLRGVPPGTYALLVYNYGVTPSDASTIYAWINTESPDMQVTVPAGVPAAFVEGADYVRFNDLVLTAGDVLSIRCLGYLSGLQLLRT